MMHVRRAGSLWALCLTAFPLYSQQSFTLPEAVDLAIHKSPLVKRSLLEITGAEARTLVAGRISNPTVGISWNESPSFSRPGDANERDLRVAQLIEFPTKRWSRVEVAESEARIQRIHHDRTLVLVRSMVGRSFYQLLYDQKRIRQLESELELARDVEQFVRSRYAAGTGSYLDMVRTKIESARIGNDLVEAKTRLEASRRELSIILGVESSAIGMLTDDFPGRVELADQDSSAQALTANSLVLKAAEEQERRGDHALSLARSSYLPDFEIGIAHQNRGVVSGLWGIELQASLPLWFWKEPAGLVSEATAQSERTKVDRLALAQRVGASVRDALGALSSTQTQVAVFDRSLLADARDIVASAYKQYQSGQMDILNLLEVFRTYRSTQTEYLRATFNHAIAVTRLEAAAELPSEETLELGVQP